MTVLPGMPRKLTDVVKEVMSDCGGRASIQDVTEILRDKASHREWTMWADSAIVLNVRNALRRKGENGLPEHLSLDGQYIYTALFSPEEYETACRRQVSRGREHIAAAYRLAEECMEQHRVRPDVDAMVKETLGEAVNGA